MIVSDPPSPGFIEFLRVNESVWGNEGTKNGYILVELIHNNAAALCLNLIVARYLGEFFGAGLLGFTAPIFTKYPVPMPQVMALARSYGVIDVVDVETEGKHCKRKDFTSRLLNLRGSEWRRSRARLLGLRGRELRAGVLDGTSAPNFAWRSSSRDGPLREGRGQIVRQQLTSRQHLPRSPTACARLLVAIGGRADMPRT